MTAPPKPCPMSELEGMEIKNAWFQDESWEEGVQVVTFLEAYWNWREGERVVRVPMKRCLLDAIAVRGMPNLRKEASHA